MVLIKQRAGSFPIFFIQPSPLFMFAFLVFLSFDQRTISGVDRYSSSDIFILIVIFEILVYNENLVTISFIFIILSIELFLIWQRN